MMRVFFVLISSLFLLEACTPEKHDRFYLTQEQRNLICFAHLGDTVIWESNSGERDTAVITPLVFKEDTLLYVNTDADHTKRGEEISFGYRIVGESKLGAIGRMSVLATDQYPTAKTILRYDGHTADNVLQERIFGGRIYKNVRFFWYRTDEEEIDSLFWNAKGFLGYNKAGVIVERIR